MRKQLIYIVTAGILFTGNAFAQFGVDRSKAPASADAKAIEFGEAAKHTLDNGLKVIIVESSKLPRVSYQLSINRPPLMEDDMVGMLDMVGPILKAGTSNRTKDQINEDADFIGASFSVSSSGLYGSSLTKHQEKLLEIMSDVLLNPTFPADELEKEKKKAISGLKASANDANTIASNVSGVLNYSKAHPYGEVMTEETVKAISIDAIKKYYENYFAPNISYLVIVGDISEEEALENAKKHFGAWAKKDVKLTEPKSVTDISQNNVAFIDKAGAVQSVIKITYPLDLKPNEDDVFAVRVMNEILGGGGFSARLMTNLREDKAYTYGAYSSLSSDKWKGQFSASASVRNEVTDSAIVQFLYEMKRIVNEPVEDQLLTLVKNKLSGAFGRSLERSQTLANFALAREINELPNDYYKTYLQKLNAVTAADVQRVAKKYIRPDKTNIVVVGNKGDVYDKLSVFNSGNAVQIYDIYGEKEKELEPITDGTTAVDVVHSYLLAITGQSKLKKAKKQLSKVSSLKIVSDMEIPGAPMKMTMEVTQKDNEKYAMAIKAGEQVFQKTVFNGTSGKQSGMMGNKDMEEDELEGMKESAVIFSEMHVDDESGYILKGIKDGLYKIEIIDAEGNPSYEFYDVESKLKVKAISFQDSPQGQVTVISDYADYKEVDGILFPHSLTQTMGPQAFDMKVKTIEINQKIEDSVFE